MAYPSFEQYNNAFQAHQQLLADPELQKGVVAKTGLGTPLAISGGFALTYTIKAGAEKFAVRCFHRESKALERRYQAIARRLAQLRSSYFLDFEFQPTGISVDGNVYPIVKMAWAQGVTLGEFLEDNHGRKGALASLPASLLELSIFLEKERVGHGDIQTGNMMVSGTSNAIQLIDYDGMFVEDIRDLGSSELGHINFQHPDRKSKNPFGPTMDRFSLIALSLALKALHEDPSLWGKTNSEMDAIVFRAGDFVDPSSSSIFSELMRKPSLATHAQNFAAVCRARIEETPSLEDFLSGKNIPVSVVQISVKPLEGRPKVGYMGVYDVLSATAYETCLRRVGDKVEVIGRIVELKEGKARNGKSYIFINFGSWQGKIFKISIWSEGLAAISKKPDASWVGKWVSVVGLMEPPYGSKKYKYSHLSINLTANGQMTVISETEAKYRLTQSSTKSAPLRTSNREALGLIKGQTLTSPPNQVSVGLSSPNQNVLDSIRKMQGGAQSRPPVISSPSSITPQRVPLSYRPTPKKGLLGKLFDWVFK